MVDSANDVFRKEEWKGITLKEMIWHSIKSLQQLDERETLLQKQVAKLEERVNQLIEGKKLSEERKRWKIAFIVSIILWILKVIIDFWLWLR